MQLIIRRACTEALSLKPEKLKILFMFDTHYFVTLLSVILHMMAAFSM